jgi:hypothetical protein
MAGNLREEGLFIPTGNPFQSNESSPFAPGQNGKVSAFANGGAENGVSGEVGIMIQAVRRYATDTVAAQSGGLAFWQDTDNFVVTSQPANAIGGTTAPLAAGIFGGTFPNAGNYGFIQVGGVALGRFAESTSATEVGKRLIWATDHQLKAAATNAGVDIPTVALLKAAVGTGTNATGEILLSLPEHNW